MIIQEPLPFVIPHEKQASRNIKSSRENEAKFVEEGSNTVTISTSHGLPAIEDAATLINLALPKPPELIRGLLHRGSKLVLGGASKSHKTWSLLDMALSISHGEPFWQMDVSPGRVLYVNLEVQREFFADRINAIAAAKTISMRSGLLEVWNLRGHGTEFRCQLEKICEQIRQHGYVLVVIDPVYKLLGDADENSARDISRLMKEIELIACDGGAAIAFGAHFAKGNAATKESMDRISGSGVFARDPDSILTLTHHAVENAFTVEATLRNFEPLAPFVVRWEIPLMRRANELDPKRLKMSISNQQYSVQTILDVLGADSLRIVEWEHRAAKTTGISSGAFYKLLREAKRSGAVQPDGDTNRWKRALVVGVIPK